MTLSIRPANPARPGFVGEVAGIDLRQPIEAATAAAIRAGMDRYAVLVFRDQRIDDTQQIAFSRHFGELELATGDDLADFPDRGFDQWFRMFLPKHDADQALKKLPERVDMIGWLKFMRVPEATMRRVCLVPSAPVMPWTMTLLSAVRKMAIGQLPFEV